MNAEVKGTIMPDPFVRDHEQFSASSIHNLDLFLLLNYGQEGKDARI